MGLLGLFAGYRSIWVEGWGRMFGVLAARTEGGDGAVEAETDKFIQK